MAFIELSHVSYTYANDGRGEDVIRDLSLTVEEGEYVAILGHNGSGKSTLAKLLNGILFPQSGTIRVNGRTVSDEDLTDEDLLELRKDIGMVFQNPDNQLVATVVEDDVAFGPENLGMPHDEIVERVKKALSDVGMSEFADREPHRLSGGQKQRVAIAGILAMMPKCIIFDESTAMLDPLGRREVLSAMETLHREKGILVINITHFMDEAAVADRVIVLQDGEIALDGTPSEVFAEEEKLNSYGLRVPLCVSMAHELEKRGISLPGDVTTPEKCAEAIAKALTSQAG